EQIVLVAPGPRQGLPVGARVVLREPLPDGPPASAQTPEDRGIEHRQTSSRTACSSASSFSASGGPAAARRIAATASIATQTLEAMMMTSSTNSSQSGPAGSANDLS